MAHEGVFERIASFDRIRSPRGGQDTGDSEIYMEHSTDFHSFKGDVILNGRLRAQEGGQTNGGGRVDLLDPGHDHGWSHHSKMSFGSL